MKNLISINQFVGNLSSTMEAFNEFDGISIAGCRPDSVYPILIQFSAGSIVATAAGTTSITAPRNNVGI